MTEAECRSFLLERARTGKLGTVRADGRPHVASIWFDVEGEALFFTTWHTSVKAANLRREPRVCLIVDDETPPFAYVQVEGTATLSDDPAELGRWATRIAGRYMGADQAEAFGKRNSVPGELLARVMITRVMGHKDVAGW